MKPIRIHLDAHAHIYPFYQMERLLLAALDHMPRTAPTDLRAIALAERHDCHVFQALAQDELRPPPERWKIVAWDPEGGVQLRHLPDHRDLWLLAGRQIRTAENIEISALFADSDIPDGQPARVSIRQILNAGGLPALNWAPGKWLGPRGRLIAALVRETPAHELALIDTSLRFTGWPEPTLYRFARQQGNSLLAGSDPLPVPGEERVAGTYYSTFSLPVLSDPTRLVAPLKAALQSGKCAITWNGKRGSPPAILQRLRRNSQTKSKT